MERNISNLDLSALTPAQVAGIWMSDETYTSLCNDRVRLLDLLLHAPTNSRASHAIINEVSVLAAAIDAYEQLHSAKEAA